MPTQNDEDVQLALRSALQNPFEETGEARMRDWYRLLTNRFPLWAFRPWHYAKVQETELPTTYPLAAIIRCILESEGLPADAQTHLPQLQATLDRIRHGLATGTIFVPELETRLYFGWTQFLPALAYGLTDWEPDTQYTAGGYYSEYEEIGLQLVEHVERLAFASKTDREPAREALKRLP